VRDLLVGLAAALLIPLTVQGVAADAARGGWRAKESVYYVPCKAKGEVIGHGTAFGHKSGKVISAAHVWADCLRHGGTPELVASDGRTSTVTVVLQDPALDLVLLQPVDGFVGKTLPISSADASEIGQQVSMWGYPGGYSGPIPLLVVGHLAGVVSHGTNAAIKRWAVNAAINGGNSGGPLLETNKASVIGVVIQKWSPRFTVDTMEKLKALPTTGHEATLLAALLEVRAQTQMVVGHSVILSDLRSFLQRAGVEP
jgi:S1-C subfamily serine protease